MGDAEFFFKAMFWMMAAPFIAIFYLFKLIFAGLGWARNVSEANKQIAASEAAAREYQAKITSPFRSDTALIEREAQERIKAANFPGMNDFADALYQHIADECAKRRILFPLENVRVALFTAMLDLYEEEGFTTPLLKRVMTDEIEEGRYRDELISLGRKAENAAQTIRLITRTLSKLFVDTTEHLPPFAIDKEEGPEPSAERAVTIPLVDLVAKPGDLVQALSMPFFMSDVAEAGLFKGVRAQLTHNGDNAVPNKVVMPDEYEGEGRKIVSLYLRDTPLRRIFDAQVPFEIPLARRLEHSVIVAGTGWGKTQLLQNMIARDLESPDPPALVVIDSTGAMIQRIQRLALFDERLADRILIIDPEHDPVPALNMFDVSNPRLQTYGRAVREEVETEIIGLFNYIFATLATELTGRMSMAFSYIVRLMLSIPGATIHTLRELLEDDANKFAPQIAKLDPTAQAFFQNHFYAKTFRPTRTAIAQRLYGLIQVPAFDRMFSSVNRVDMFTELQRGSIVLINTSTRLLKEDASPLFGRYMIARTLAAIFERAALPEEDRRPAFLIIDEAAPYFDDTFDAMLTRVRQFKLGVVIAFQHLEQAGDRLRSAIASNTAIKYAGGAGYNDSRWLAREMRTSPEFIQGQKRDAREPPRFTQFACHVRNFTDTAVSLTVPIGTLEKLPRMSEEAHRRLLARNRERVSAVPARPTPAPSEHSEGPIPPEGDVSAKAAEAAASVSEPAPKPEGTKSKRKSADSREGENTEGAADWR